jgi:hypothetical protein
MGTIANEDLIRFELEHSGAPPERIDRMVASEARSWGGHYFHNEWQIVRREDAAGLAEALERALPDIPDHDAMVSKTLTTNPFELSPDEDIETGIRTRISECFAYCPQPGESNSNRPDPYGVSPLEVLSGVVKDLVRVFIVFCRNGGFYIA